MRKDRKTNKLYVNLHRYILQIIRETEVMWKLKLDVPETAQMLAFCKNDLLFAFETAKHYANRFNQLKLSIKPEFVPLMRTQLIHLDHIFAPALSIVTWASQGLPEYLKELDKLLTEMEWFIKDTTDISEARIDEILDMIADTDLVYCPPHPVLPTEFYELNVKHRQVQEKTIELRNKSAELAAIELINMFVQKIDVPDVDEHGKRKFMLPLKEITEANRRVEDQKPVDKYDWVSFEKLYKAVMYSEGAAHEIACKFASFE